MSYSRRSRRYSPSPSPPHKRYGRPVSRSRSSSRSRYDSSDIENPGNNLYVTGLSPRITKRDLEKHFSAEGKVEDVHLVMDPWTRESRGFAFVSMSNIKEADRCIKYLDGSVLEGRVITVEKARRRRGRTPTPGRYLGLRSGGGGGGGRRGRSPTYSPPYLRRSCSSGYSSERYRGRSRSRSYSPYYTSRRRRRSYSPYSRSPSPIRRSYTPDEDDYSSRRSYSPQYRRRKGYRYSPHYTTRRRRRRRSPLSPSPSSPGRRRYRGRSYSPSPSVSLVWSRRSRRSYSPSSRSRSPASAYSSRSASLTSSRSSSPYI